MALAAGSGSCGSCGAPGAEFACSRCKAVRFCGPECFKAGWKAHKPTCRAPALAPTPSEPERRTPAPKPEPAASRQDPAAAASPAAASAASGSTVIAEGRIFVSVAAYCDPELPLTLRSLLLHAEHPERLFLGLVWQGPDDPLRAEDLKDIAKLWGVPVEQASSTSSGGMLPLPGHRRVTWDALLGGRIRLVCMPPEEARGPCWARYLAQLLWKGEELYLQLDSHMRFVPQWDRHMRQQLAWCGEWSAKPILCSYGRGYARSYPPDWVPPGDISPCLNCAGFFDDTNIINIRYRTLKSDWMCPQKCFFWSAHFSFSSSEVLREVPYDPHLLMLFYGEEILMSVRFFTHGWDMYSPSRGLVYHLWERDYRRVYFFDNKELYADLAKPSRRRLHWQLGSGPEPFFDEVVEDWPLPGDKKKRKHDSDPFVMGTVRTVQDYEDAADVSFKGRRLGALALRGGAPSEFDFMAQESGDQSEIEARCRQKNSKNMGAAGRKAAGGSSDDSDDEVN